MDIADEPDHRSPTTLDPQDWSAFRARAHAMLNQAVDKMQSATNGRVWTPLPDDLQAQLHEKLPSAGKTVNEVDEALVSLLPYGVGNTHPRFMGWVHGAGTPSGILAEMIAAAMNANAGGRDHAAIHVERQLSGWVRNLFGFPGTASGLTVSGTSMATFIALKVARDSALGFASRKDGVGPNRLVAYTSEQAHACNARAMDMLGLGSDALRQVPSDRAFHMDVASLKGAIARDKANGNVPFAVIGTAGTVNTGAIDNLNALADITRDERLWFHIDGAFAASGIMSERLKQKLKGIERADSIAFDFHKWLHVNYDAGFVLIRDETLHRRAFSLRPEYLKGAERGLAAGNPWPVEYGPELSRGFRSLKVWAHLQEFGTERLGAAISANCVLVEKLAGLVDEAPDLERLAPVETSICCFRYRTSATPDDRLDQINEEIVIRLQESGIAAPSTTRIDGQLAIRVNITNHRTRESDLGILVEAIREIAPEAIAACC